MSSVHSQQADAKLWIVCDLQSWATCHCLEAIGGKVKKMTDLRAD